MDNFEKAPIPNPEPTTALQGRTAARSPTGPSGRPPQPSWPAAAVLTSSADQAATRPEGLHPRPGVGTFVTATLADDSLAAHGLLRQELRRWLARARRAGLDEESIEALFMTRVRNAAEEDMA